MDGGGVVLHFIAWHEGCEMANARKMISKTTKFYEIILLFVEKNVSLHTTYLIFDIKQWGGCTPLSRGFNPLGKFFPHCAEYATTMRPFLWHLKGICNIRLISEIWANVVFGTIVAPIRGCVNRENTAEKSKIYHFVWCRRTQGCGLLFFFEIFTSKRKAPVGAISYSAAGSSAW